MKKINYKNRKKTINWVCRDCGKWMGNAQAKISTWHDDKCDVCGKFKPVTELRDFFL